MCSFQFKYQGQMVAHYSTDFNNYTDNSQLQDTIEKKQPDEMPRTIINVFFYDYSVY